MTKKLSEHDKLIEVFTDYKNGLRNNKTATAELLKMGFEPNVAYALLKVMRKENVVDIRGYSKAPKQFQRWRADKEKQQKPCGKGTSDVETDNK